MDPVLFNITKINPEPLTSPFPDKEGSSLVISCAAQKALFKSNGDKTRYVGLGPYVFKAYTAGICESGEIKVFPQVRAYCEEAIKKGTLQLRKVKKKEIRTNNITACISVAEGKNVDIDFKRKFKNALFSHFLGKLIVKGKEYRLFRYANIQFLVSFPEQTDKYALLSSSTKLKLRRNLSKSGDIVFVDRIQTRLFFEPKLNFSYKGPDTLTVGKDFLLPRLNQIFQDNVFRCNYPHPLQLDNGERFTVSFPIDSNPAKFVHWYNRRVGTYHANDLERIALVSTTSKAPELPAPPQTPTPAPKEEPKAQTAIKPLKSIKVFMEENGMRGVPEKMKQAAYATLAVFGPEWMQKVAKARGVEGARGVLFHGKPGNGKTRYAKLFLEWLKIDKIVHKSGSEFLSRYVGNTEEAIRELFKEAVEDWKKNGKKAKTYGFFMDEIDALLPDRSKAGDKQWQVSTVEQMLTSLEAALGETENIIFIAATNFYENLDPALKRWGRLGIHVEISNPDKKLRVELFKHYLEPLKKAGILEDSIDIERLVQLTENHSAADIKGIAEKANADKLASDFDSYFDEKQTPEEIEKGGKGKVGMKELEALILKK